MSNKKINYLNNKDILAEMYKSKNTYCEFFEDGVKEYDIIVDTPRPKKKGAKIKIPPPWSDEYKTQLETRRERCLSPETIRDAKINRANRISLENYNEALKLAVNTGVKPIKADYMIDPNTIRTEDLVIRFHTYEHIPLKTVFKENPETEADYRKRFNFIPFLHYRVVTNQDQTLSLRVVAKSHSKNGEYSSTHGSITSKLATMFILITDKYAQKHNWRGYTYVDDMKGRALLQLADVGLHFNEARSDNPFAYLTQVLKNSFLRVLLAEQKQQEIRDDLLESMGDAPSNTRQLEYETEFFSDLSKGSSEYE